MVVHRAGPVSDRSERISMVNGYVALDTSLDQQSRSADLIGVDDPSVLWTEWAKMAAWRSSGRLSALVEGLPFTDDRDFVVEQLQAAIQDAQQAIEEIQGDAVPAEHYGG
jgi:NACalpha-BTF3-like transcription factor